MKLKRLAAFSKRFSVAEEVLSKEKALKSGFNAGFQGFFMGDFKCAELNEHGPALGGPGGLF